MFTTESRIQQTQGQQVAVCSWVLLSALVVLGLGCGPQELPGQEERGAAGAQEQQVAMANGLSLNGLSLNGLSLNGLSLNGLSLNGLSALEFRTWFDSDPELYAGTMQYMVYCAVPEGQTRSYTSLVMGQTYTWGGHLGLAPGWASGLPATEPEQQLVSACLAAHVNKFGVHVQISLLGQDGTGEPIAFSAQELADYSVREGCFFGNLFREEPVQAGNDGLTLAPGQSTTRVCALPGVGGSSQCSPMVYVGSCSTYCTRSGSNPYYDSCTYNGKRYRPITTRLLPTAVTP
jgi:hypothetical protein